MVHFSSRSRILLTDDDPDVRGVWSDILSKKTDHIVDQAENGLVAQDKLAAANAEDSGYDLLIADMRMPKMGGESLIRELRKTNLDIAIIIITGHAVLSEAYDLLKKFQISDFLSKPLQHPAVLLFSVENTLEKQRLARQERKQIKELAESNENLRKEIQQRRKVEEDLRKSEGKNRAILEAIPDLIFRINRNGVYTEIFPGKGLETLVPASEFLGKTLNETLPADVAQKAGRAMEKVFQTGDLQVFDFELFVGGKEHQYRARLIGIDDESIIAIVQKL
ncbi:MAG: response regulator [SAR324 cluster bacterium]|nr:response regulator [SAR324 cluster bacterium]